MTHADADRIIGRIRADEIQLHQTDHFRRTLGARRFSPHDVRAILRAHEMESAPEWDEQHRDYTVCLIGKCLEGRRTRLVLGLREDGPCVAVTIMVARDGTGGRRIR
jgi:hypothetical protein